MQTKKIIYISVFMGIITSFFLIRETFTQEAFNPADVQSRECKEGKLKCGFNPDPVEKVESVPLAESTMISHRGLPSKVDFSKEMPPVLSQGRQNSCVAFSTGYYTKSYYEYKKNRWRYDTPIYGGEGKHVFSPAYIYNQINGGRDRGSYFHDALNLIVKKGAAPWKYMPYNERDYLSQPSRQAHQIAKQFKAKSFRRIPFSNLNAIKSELAKGNPIIFGIVIDDNFYRLGSEVFDNPGGKKYGGHAMTLVGYDDNKRSPKGYKGAFKLINSWGTRWGDKGYGWISYRTWMQLRPYVYVLYDEKSKNQIDSVETNVVTESKYIPSPGNVSATKGTYSNKVVITWNPVSVAVAYAILRLDPGASDFEVLGYAYKNSYEDKAVSPNVSYKYVVISLSENKTSDPKKAVIVTGYASTQKISDIPKIYNLKAVFQKGQVYIYWEKVPGVHFYQIRRWDERRQRWFTWNRPIRVNRFVDKRPIPDQINRYSVRASINRKYGEWSSPVEVNIPGGNTPPPTPKIVEISQGLYRDKIIIRWNAVSGAQKYLVFRYDYSLKMWEGPYTVNSSVFVDRSSKIMNGDWFAYTVVAMNSAGKSDYSNVVLGNVNPNVHRAGEVLPPPTELQIEVKNKNVIIQWKLVKGANEYYVYRKKKGEKEYQFIQAVTKNQFQEKFPGKPGELYFYAIRSKSLLGKESINSKPVVAFMNPEIQVVTHRFMPGQGMEKFLGTWKGSYWDGSSQIEYYKVNITGKGDIMQLVMKKNEKEKQKFTTKYPAMSDVVRFSDFELVYKPDFEVLILEGKSGPFRGKTITLTK